MKQVREGTSRFRNMRTLLEDFHLLGYVLSKFEQETGDAIDVTDTLPR